MQGSDISTFCTVVLRTNGRLSSPQQKTVIIAGENLGRLRSPIAIGIDNSLACFKSCSTIRILFSARPTSLANLVISPISSYLLILQRENYSQAPSSMSRFPLFFVCSPQFALRICKDFISSLYFEYSYHPEKNVWQRSSPLHHFADCGLYIFLRPFISSSLILNRYQPPTPFLSFFILYLHRCLYIRFYLYLFMRFILRLLYEYFFSLSFFYAFLIRLESFPFLRFFFESLLSEI